MMRIANFWKMLVAGIIACVSAFVVYYFSTRFQNPELRNRLMVWYPYFTKLNLLLLVAGGFLCFPVVKELLNSRAKRLLIPAVVLSLAGLLLTSCVAYRTNRIYYDEHIYQHTGQNISLTGQYFICNEGEFVDGDYHPLQKEYNKWSIGYPVLLSVVYSVLGVNDTIAFNLNNVLFGLTIFLIFVIGSLLFSREAGLFSALIYALIPQNIIWFNTAAVEPSSTFVICLTMAAFLLYIRTERLVALFFAIMTCCFAVTFRIDAIIILPVLGLMLLFKRPKTYLDPNFYLLLSVGLFLLVFHFLHIYAVRGDAWGATGPRFALSYLKNNLSANMGLFTKNKDFPALFTIFFFSGMMPFGNFKSKAITLSWFAAYFGIFLLFYAGSYYYGADIRFSLLAMPPFALIAGYGTCAVNSRLRKHTGNSTALIVLVMIAAFSFSLPGIKKVGEEAWAARTDVQMARKMMKTLPADSIILTHNPSLFLLWGGNSAQTSLATYNKERVDYFLKRYRGGVYFQFGFWCNVKDTLQTSFCKNILELYDTDKLMEHYRMDNRFALYRIRQRKADAGNTPDNLLSVPAATLDNK